MVKNKIGTCSNTFLIYSFLTDIKRYLLKASTVPSLVTFKQRGQERLSRQNFIIDLQCSLILTFVHVTSKSIGVIYSLGTSIVTNMATFKQRDRENISSKSSCLTLTFHHVTSKSIGVIYPPGTSVVPSLATFKQKGQDIERTSFQRPAV